MDDYRWGGIAATRAIAPDWAPFEQTTMWLLDLDVQGLRFSVPGGILDSQRIGGVF
jgi:hypothetical protein